MNTKSVLLAALSLGAVAFAQAQSAAPAVKATPSAQAAAEIPQKLDKFMVTGSMAEPKAEAEKLEKFMVTGSMAEPQGKAEELPKFMVTGSLAEPTGETAKLDKFMVTGSMAAPRQAQAKR